MLDNIYTLPYEKVAEVEWTGYDLAYDLQLYMLGEGHKEFKAVNPYVEDKELIHFIKDIPESRKCIVWTHNGDWVVKLFKDGWYPYHGYESIEIVKPTTVWSRNNDIDQLMTFENDPRQNFEPTVWDAEYELVWYIDPRFNPLEEKVWAISCRPMGQKIKGIKDMGYVVPELEVEYNGDLPNLGLDLDSMCPPYYDLHHECSYMLDKTFSEFEDIWVVRFRPAYRVPESLLWVGTVSPTFNIIKNPALPDMDYDVDYAMPWRDFWFEHAWMLDSKHTKDLDEEIWAFTISVNTTSQLDGTKIIDEVSPTMSVEYHPDAEGFEFPLPTIDDFRYYDFKYTHTYMLDKAFTEHFDLWAYKVSFGKDGLYKEAGYVTPIVKEEYNPDLGYLKFKIDYTIPAHDREYVHVWYLDPKFSGEEKIWAAKLSAGPNASGEKEMGYITPAMPKTLDVIFISYNEANAEDNWLRVQQKAPWAKRVDGVEGIFNAHKEAARIAETDMFYVVDGDAYLEDSWKFNFQPGIFDRDCAYVWTSRNPINSLTYGYGGVKLFSKRVLMKTKKWTSLDMFTGVMPKLKVIDRISNITAFNTDEFSTWRSAFRECVKLASNDTPENKERLDTWLSTGADKEFGMYAIEAAHSAVNFVSVNKKKPKELAKINDYSWLETEFKKQYD
jgi:hypothetical protein